MNSISIKNLLRKRIVIWCFVPVVQHGEELDHNWHSEAQNEHEGNGIDRNEFSSEFQLEVDLGDLNGQWGVEELEGKGRHQPQGVHGEEGEVYLCVMTKI